MSLLDTHSRNMSKPHAVVLPFPLQGHLNPTLQLSKILAAKGFIITFVNTEFNSRRMLAESQSQPHHKAQGLDIRFAELPDGLPVEHGRGLPAIYEVLKSVMTTMGPCFEGFVESLMAQDPPVTCIISSSFMHFAQDVANKLGIPYAAIWTQSAASYASVLLVTKGFRPPSEPHNLITSIPGAPPLKLGEMNTFLQSYDPSDFMFDLFTRPFQRIGESAWILINSFDELEREGVEALLKEHPIAAVGPLLPSSFFDKSIHSQQNHSADLLPAEGDCLSWLDAQPPASVLYVSFGSLAVLSVKQIEEIALGLEASQQPFLWVVRPDLMSGEAAVFPEGFLHRVKDRAVFVSWAPQLQVLSHNSLGGFFTHCGWNSTLESIAAGVPMLGWAYISDQPMNCRCFVDGWKIGLRLELDEDGLATRMEVEKKVRDLMEGERGSGMRERARMYRDAARKSVQEGGSSRKNLERFVDDMKSRA